MNLKVLIVDDDQNYRYALSKIIDWNDNGYEIVGQAIHGKQALEFLSANKVDIILTDISMPQMNGVELIKHVRVKYPSIKIIVLSAYDEFELVKESLKYGAEDYILKYQIDPNYILRCFNQTKEKILKESHTDKLIGFIKNNKFNLSEDIFKEAILSDSLDKNKLDGYLKYRGYDEKTMSFMVFVIKIPGSLNDDVFSSASKKLIELFGDGTILCRTQSKSVAVLIDFSEISSKEKQHQKALLAANKMSEIFSSKKDKVKIGISGLNNESENLRAAYEQATTALGQILYLNTGGIFFYSDNLKENKNINSEIADALDKLKKSVNSKNTDLVLSTIDSIIEDVKTSKPDISRLDKLFLDIYLVVNMAAYKIGTTGQLSAEEIEIFRNQIGAADSVETKRSILLNKINKVCTYLNEVPKVMSRDVQKVIGYVYKNYKNDITLKDISDAVGLSPNYLCNLFKQETGRRLMEFINLVRINRSKTMLEETNLKVYEIAELVGYNNTTYFSTMFKKITNTTVMEYRKSVNADNL